MKHQRIEAPVSSDKPPLLGEEWHPVHGYDGLYDVSNLGRVRSYHYGEPRLIAPHISNKGYPTVSLHGRGKRKEAGVHSLVAIAFHGDKRNALHREVAHMDGNRANPRADNLKWVSTAENRSHRKMHGTETWGERHPLAALTNAQAIEVKRLIAAGARICAIAAKYGVSWETIRGIKRGRNWRHVG